MSERIDSRIVEEPLSVSEVDYSRYSEKEKMALRLATWLQFAQVSPRFGAESTKKQDSKNYNLSTPNLTIDSNKKQNITTAIIPVAGLGTRFLPATKSIPKEIMTLVDRPLIQYTIDEARAAGIRKFIFVTARGKSALEDYFDRAPELENALRQHNKPALAIELERTNMASGAVAFVRQYEAYGLGYSVWCAREFIAPGEHFAVMLPDDIVAANKSCLQQMVDTYNEVGGNLVAAIEVPSDNVDQYGVIDTDNISNNIVNVRNIVDNPDPKIAPTNLAVIGRYILSRNVIENLEKRIKEAELLKKRSTYSLTEAISDEAIQGRSVRGLRFSGSYFDCGSKEGFIQATIAFALARDDLHSGISEFIRSYSEIMERPELKNVILLRDHLNLKAS